ncbi:hypothetical protein AAFF_G00205190 [Aldrovandia affinis]|uniref:Phospholipid scramblase n=1 Tax=Aldrovandia affinis TaxID=143900 RepID=A0AAD7W4W6_9TELE|nr:hypothetical protein AAFF_G00205190 [Aldrovandia affinis]
MEGPCIACNFCRDVNFELTTKDGSQAIGRISKQWSGLLKELCSDEPNSEIQFPRDLDVKMKAVAMAACFLILSMLLLFLLAVGTDALFGWGSERPRNLFGDVSPLSRQFLLRLCPSGGAIDSVWRIRVEILCPSVVLATFHGGRYIHKRKRRRKWGKRGGLRRKLKLASTPPYPL